MLDILTTLAFGLIGTIARIALVSADWGVSM
jgi:hypothetical protein